MEAQEFLATRELPPAVKNYRTPRGWSQAMITAVDDAIIQAEVRKRHNYDNGFHHCDIEKLIYVRRPIESRGDSCVR
jgi:hypothetical protein